MRTFDANCRIGRYNAWSGREPVTAPDLLATMDHYGIHEALVLDSLAVECHAVDGNRRVLELIESQPRLQPAWVGLPPGSREMASGRELVAQMSEQDVRALFLFPQQYHFTLDDWCVDRLVHPLAERKVPVFVCPNTLLAAGVQDQTDWAGVVRVCQTFPDLPVVVSEFRISYTLRSMYEALEACPNLRVDISALWLHHAIEFVVREWGAERLVYGSGLPVRDPAAPLCQLTYSDIPVSARDAIAGDTLRSLLSWADPVAAPEVRFPEPIDELHALARSGQPLAGQRFFCSHGHLGRHFMLHIPDSTPGELVVEMDRMGVEHGLIFANGGLNSDEVYGNDLVAQAVAEHPHRFTGLVCANMNRSAEIIRSEIERGFALGMRGIKLHPYLNGYDTCGPNVEVACAIANERRCIIINHDWGPSERILDLCRKYPNATFVTGHTSPAALPVVAQVDNLYVGSNALHLFRSAEGIVEEVGADRLLFSSDLSWNPVAWGLGPLLYARLPLEAKREILGGNIRRLMSSNGGA
jgi:predicted TIM-barrel fold metal-dependent hydrolase